MKRFAELLDRLAFEPSRNGKLRLMTDYFAHTPDPDRGVALAALTGALKFSQARPAMVRALIATRVDETLFALSYDFVGDLSETVALLWPTPPAPDNAIVGLTEVVHLLETTGKTKLPDLIAALLDRLDERGRWALLKLITGALRIGVSARLTKTAVAALGGHDPNDVENVWPGLSPPYLTLFAWLEGRGDKPEGSDPAPFRPAMLAHALEEKDFATLDPADFAAEWKWDGVRVQVSAGAQGSAGAHDEQRVARLWSRSGEDMSHAFPELVEAFTRAPFERFSLDGELLIVRDGLVQSFATLQQRLNRKTVTAKLIAEFPAHIRAYDLLAEGDEDLRALPFVDRRARLEAFVARHAAAGGAARLDLSPLLPFQTWDDLAQARAEPATHHGGADVEAIEGVMVKRLDSPYTPGRPKGPWWKWKRDPFTVDAVLMYAQRGHGKRSSFYSDYTFGVWRAGEHGDELTPVGKAYFGFTDAELKRIDRYVREHTTNRFGPVREVAWSATQGLVFEIAFEGLQRSPRHKSGLAMRFPRIARIRWDKPAGEADRIETLFALLGEDGAQTIGVGRAR